MKLQVAMETLDNAASEMGRPEDPKLWDAMCLGVEALKLIQFGRYNNMVLTANPLPGETKEE